MAGRSGEMYVQVAIEPADGCAGAPVPWRTAAACGDRALAQELCRGIEAGLLRVGDPIGRALVRAVSRDDLAAEGGEPAVRAAAADLDLLADGLWTNRSLLAGDVVSEARLRAAGRVGSSAAAGGARRAPGR
ncbi:MAG: hypothetical protein R3C15_08330 [Thermoleophilia bacterium]